MTASWAAEPEEIKTSVNAGGDPLGFVYNGKHHQIVAIYERWRISDEWWCNEIKRRYFRVGAANGAVCDIYHDVVNDVWRLYKVLD